MESSSQKSVMDSRGYLFLLPPLGLPDPTDEWVQVKAAIGTKQGALHRLVHDKSLKTPLRHKQAGTVLMPIDVKDGTLILPFFKPASEDPSSPPEYFSTHARYVPSGQYCDDGMYTQSRLPDDINWVIYPMALYEDMAPTFAAIAAGVPPEQRKRKPRSAEYKLEVGTAARALDWKKEEPEERENVRRSGRKVSDGRA